MTDLNGGAGVPQNNQRINPEGILPGALPNNSVPTNVPFVQPARGFTQYEPQTGALALAQQLGNIDFGALSRGFQQRQEITRKLRDEQQRAAGQAEAAKLLSQTGMDLQTLVKSGRIPASSTSAFMLGASYAASQNTLAALREAVAKRRTDNPDAPVFTQDANFMAQFYSQLNGARNEAVVKNFIEPMQDLAADDAKAHAKFYDSQATSKFMGDAIGTFEKSVASGDDPGAALNNAINVLQLGLHKTPENVKALITSAGPQILERVTNKDTGKVDMAEAARLMTQIAGTKIFADGNRRLSGLYYDAYKELGDFVYGSVNKAATAEKAQSEAAVDEATLKQFDWLAANFSSTTTEQQVRNGISLGLPYDVALNMTKGWDTAPGNKSKEQLTQEKQEADNTFEAMNLTPSQRKQEMEYLLWAKRSHQFDGREDEWNKRFKALREADSHHESAPISGNDRNGITTTIYNQMQTVFGSPRSMQAALLGATGRYGLPASATDRVRHIVSERLTDAATQWIMSSGNFGMYQAAVDNVQSDPSGPSRVMTQLTQQFLANNHGELSTLIPKALASSNPDAALSTLRLGGPRPTTRVYNGTPAQVPRPSNVPAPVAVSQVAREVAATHTNLLDTRTDIYHWFATNARLKNPRLTDAQILSQLQKLPIVTIRELQELYKKEHH